MYPSPTIPITTSFMIIDQYRKRKLTLYSVCVWSLMPVSTSVALCNHYHNEDTMAQRQDASVTTKSSLSAVYSVHSPISLATANLCSVCIILSFQEGSINGILCTLQSVTFKVLFPSQYNVFEMCLTCCM